MKIAKEFRWEMGHRLLCHVGKCKNLHGHSYRMQVEITSDILTNGMVVDYYDLKKTVEPFVEELDHAFMINHNDKVLLNKIDELNTKHIIVEFETTAENICRYFIDKIKPKLPNNITNLRVTIFETSTSYATEEINI